ncbi:MAG: hypothetical protein ABSG60_14050 [Terracidiphilus sp.]
MKKEVFAAILLLVLPALGQNRQCKGNPKVVGACYMVHGRATFGSGTPALRIWPVGTKHMLGVTAGPIADDADEPIAPKNLKFNPGVESIFGDFEVCPFTRERKGSMQMVCVESAKNLVFKK